MLLFILHTFALDMIKNPYLSTTIKRITPVNTPNLHLGEIKSGEDSHIAIINDAASSEKNNGGNLKNDKIVLQRPPKCNGYNIYINDKLMCYDGSNRELFECKDKSKLATLWDFQILDSGAAICTSVPYNYIIGKYYFKYCLSYDKDTDADGNHRLTVEYERKDFPNQAFDVYEEFNNEKIVFEQKSK